MGEIKKNTSEYKIQRLSCWFREIKDDEILH